MTQVALFAIFGLTTAGAIALVSSLPGYAVTAWPAMMFLALAFMFSGVIYIAVRLAAAGDAEYYDDYTPTSKILSICFICIFGTLGGLSASFSLSKSIAQAALGSVHCSYDGTCTPGTNPHRLSSALPSARNQANPNTSSDAVTPRQRRIIRTQQPQPSPTLAVRPNQLAQPKAVLRPRTTPRPSKPRRQTVAYVEVLTANPAVVRGLRSGLSVFKARPVGGSVQPRVFAQRQPAGQSGSQSVAYRQPAPSTTVQKTSTAAVVRKAPSQTTAPNGQAVVAVALPSSSEAPSAQPSAATKKGRPKTAAGRATLKNAEATLEQSNSLLKETEAQLSDIEVVYEDPLLGDLSSLDNDPVQTRAGSGAKSSRIEPTEPSRNMAKAPNSSNLKLAQVKPVADAVKPVPAPRVRQKPASLRKAIRLARADPDRSTLVLAGVGVGQPMIILPSSLTKSSNALRVGVQSGDQAPSFGGSAFATSPTRTAGSFGCGGGAADLHSLGRCA